MNRSLQFQSTQLHGSTDPEKGDVHQLFAALTILVSIASISYAQPSAEVVVPPFKDKYSSYVAQLEAGHTEIDYRDFRYSLIESEQFKISSIQRSQFDSLRKEMLMQIKQSAYQKIIGLCKQLLSIDYTSMLAHKILRQTYEILDDTLHARKYKAIELGLLKSIVTGRDGTTHESAWPVIQIAEEYFILQMLGTEVVSQALERNGGAYDRMEVTVSGKKRTYYFDVAKVLQGYKRFGPD